ncbi:MAG: hypothetical protein Q9174_004088 [Haloplaca sp. 1 TL-2023]
MQHRTPDKAQHYIDLLESARCKASWSEVPEIVRKLSKHAPQRKCLQLTAQAEYQAATYTAVAHPRTSDTASKLSQLIPALLSSAQDSSTPQEDAFQAHVCLGWIHWILKEPSLALKRLSPHISDHYGRLETDEATVSSWTKICAMKGTYITGVLQDNVGSTGEALKLYKSILPRVADTILTSSSAPEYRNWAERLLVHCCVLSNKIASLPGGKEHGVQSSGITLAPFRIWASFWESTSQYRSSTQANQSARIDSAAQRQIWRLYYDTLSAILQRGQAYPMASHANPYVAEISSGDAHSSKNSRLQQNIELRRVESIYEGLLLSDIPFPKASETNMEIEHWIDQVMVNWRVVFGPAWRGSDLGSGGKETVTRNVLAEN